MKFPIAFVVLLPITVAAQAPPRYSTIVQDMRDREFSTIRGDFIAAAELMPAEQYGFKPVETVRSFGDEVAHATAVNRRLCGMASGAAAPPRQTAAPQPGVKAELVSALKSSFEQCADVLAAQTDATVLTPTAGPYIRASHLTAMLGHNNEVYGKIALMLRMKGLVPPSTSRQGRQ
jgi:uncharacterized damage-inducible protein DinB